MKPLAAILVAVTIVVAFTSFYASASSSLSNPLQSSATQSSNVVYLDVIPDYGGPTYDAFVLPASINGQTPANAAAGGTPPNNNVTVSHGVPIRFVITSLDTAVLQNFTSHVSVPFTIYNDSASGQVALQYTQGETVSNMPIGHTFTITSLNVNIPIPPDTMVVFTYTFSTPGVYSYICETPCGAGMGLKGYMLGYIIVT
jgi:plastocyanin